MDELWRLGDIAFAENIVKKPGLDELLTYLAAKNIPLAVASSSIAPIVKRNLTNGGVTHFFRHIVSGDMVQRSKPAPDIFLKAAAALGTDPARTLVLEDSYNGSQTVLLRDVAVIRDGTEEREQEMAERFDEYRACDDGDGCGGYYEWYEPREQEWCGTGIYWTEWY